MIEKMCRLSMAVPESLGMELIDFLQADGRVHLILPSEEQHNVDLADRLLVLREKLRAVVETLEGIAVSASAESVPAAADAEVERILSESLALTVPELEKSVEKFQAELARIMKGHDRLTDEKKLLERILAQLGTLAFKDSLGRRCLLWWVAKDLWPLALRQIERQCADGEKTLFHVHDTAKEDQLLVELSVPAARISAVTEILHDIGAAVWTPPPQYAGKNYAESMELMKRRLSEIQSLLKAEQSALVAMRKQWGPRQKAFFLLIDRKVDQYQVFSRCDRLGGALLVEGWMPQRGLEDFRVRLEEKFAGRVALHSREPEPDEYGQVPTALRHGAFFAPFAVFLKLVQPPAYGTADPTSLIGVFFPFFAGCIIGDAGYGLVMLILMCFVRRRAKSETVRDVAFVLMTMCVWSILWGAAFGEFFGDFAHRMFHVEPLWVERSQAVMPVLMFSVALGLGHVLLGLAVGLIHGLKARHKKHAMEKLGAMLVILVMVAALMSVRRLLPPQAFPGSIAALVVGLVLLTAGGGIGGLIEAMSSFGHILSYVRIGAIGLSSAILAVAASKFVDVLGVSALGLFVALAIHLLNFVLAFAESGLHAARLHYVEFMGNFYAAQGKDYHPFIYRRKLSWKKDS
ncbi:V-type ATP synthase subunit I [Pyramidobacter sp. CG50-2]|uniref:V-type ATP synthase subunit I n=1 Tax=Pyramidobacter sp. CG50-2 TaxID=2382160 RepID=UPI000EA1F2E9|nr:V-type ATPase 116kDa subunit family protein [Pyramidobacter sp. CG50-2]RKJ77425.1 V-type ATP synthase subunit I [Pyramidobacter sp. CG50-2]